MLASYDWRLRHAGLMAIAAIGEGTSKVSWLFVAGKGGSLTRWDMQIMQNELGKVVE